MMSIRIVPALLLVLVAAAGCYTQLAPPLQTATTVNDAPLPPPLHGTWQWVRLVDAEGGTLTVNDPARFSLSLGGANHLAVQLDCNRGRAKFVTVTADSLTVGPISATKIYCGPESLDKQFHEALRQPAAYEAHQDSLLLRPERGGTMTFRRAPR